VADALKEMGQTVALFKATPIYDRSANNSQFIEEWSSMDFTSRQLRAFLFVAQHRNFSRAAEALFITPSGLSVLIRELETQLGFRLFDRTTRHVGLTTFGSELLAEVRDSLNKIDATVSRIGRSAVEASHAVSIGAPLPIANNILPDAIKEFRTIRPDIRIRVTDIGGEALTRLVQEGKLDMTLGAFFEPGMSIRKTPLFRFSLMVVRPDSGQASRRTLTTWSALKAEPLISLVPANVVQKFIDKQLARAEVFVPRRAEFNHLDTLIAMVEAGEGTAVIPAFALPSCRNRKVVLSRLINPVVNVDLCRVSLRGKKLPPGADDFTSFLKSYIARWAGRSGIL
jgi:LysR family transcriptional regulator, carnitine catabolism transcriptional activator